MTTTDYMNALVLPMLRQYWWLFLLLIAGSILKLYAPIIKGKIGEGLVNFAAKRRLDPNTYTLLKDVTIPSQNGTTQIDHIIVSVYGIFVIETKNYKGWIFGDAKSRQWTQVNFKQKNRFQNPLHQNYGHVCALADLLDISKDKIHGVVCFMGDARFKTGIPEGVFIQGQYIRHILSFQTPILSKEEVSELTQKIEAGRFERGIKTNCQHVKQLKARHAVAPKENQSAEPLRKTCPSCGAEMMMRTAKRGANAGHSFWGCSAYPKCRTTEPIATEPFS